MKYDLDNIQPHAAQSDIYNKPLESVGVTSWSITNEMYFLENQDTLSTQSLLLRLWGEVLPPRNANVCENDEPWYPFSIYKITCSFDHCVLALPPLRARKINNDLFKKEQFPSSENTKLSWLQRPSRLDLRCQHQFRNRWKRQRLLRVRYPRLRKNGLGHGRTWARWMWQM